MIRALAVTAASLVAAPADAARTPPRTGCAQSGTARRTSRPEEQDALTAVDRANSLAPHGMRTRGARIPLHRPPERQRPAAAGRQGAVPPHGG